VLNVIKDVLFEENVSLAENIVCSAFHGIIFVTFALLLWNHLRYGNEDNTVWQNRHDTIDYLLFACLVGCRYLLFAGIVGCLLSFAILALFPQNLFEAGVLIDFWLFDLLLSFLLVCKAYEFRR